jgi:hypothetical protein
MSLSRLGYVAAASLFWAGAACAQSATNLITNGDFEQTSNGAGELMPPGTSIGYRETSATGWYTSTTTSSSCSNTNCNQGYPFDFIAAAGTATTTGFPDAWDGSNKEIWGNANGGKNSSGGQNGFTGYSPSTDGSTNGGNFLVADGDYHRTAVSQNVTGLVKGQTYSLSFDWAAGQWDGFTGATTEQWQVSIGNQTFNTATYNLNSTGFSGWMHQVFTFTYDGSSDILSFLAYGTPVGEPPMLLLDGVSLYDVPEPAAWTLLGLGLMCIGALRRRQRAALI